MYKLCHEECTSSIKIILRIYMVTAQAYYLVILIVWFMKLKFKMFMKILAKIKKFFILVAIHLSQKYYDDSNQLIVGKIKDQTSGFAIEEFIGSNPKMYSFLVDDPI